MSMKRWMGHLPVIIALLALFLFITPVAADEYNGYMGKWMYGGNNSTTVSSFEGYGNIAYYTQPEDSYKGVGWVERTEIWTETDLPIPSGASIEMARLYISYTWDSTPGGIPNVSVLFNNQQISLPDPYTDQSNRGFYGDMKYGLFALDVTQEFNDDENTLIMTANSGNSQAIYPSTLVVIYTDNTEPKRQIFINEECDLIGYSGNVATYNTTQEEATTYTPFSGKKIEKDNIKNATLHSFAASAGPDEGNLIWNNEIIERSAWHGTSNTASAEIFNVTDSLTDTNIAGIQATEGVMVPLQQIMVIEYTQPEDLPLDTVKSGTVKGGFFFESQDVYGAKPAGADRTVTFELPEYDSIEWARLYTLVYSGHMTDDRSGRVTTTFDGGSGITELGNEILNIPAPRNGQVYWVNDHVNRVTSDYQIWYDVTGEITGTEVTAHVLSEEVDDNWDGRIRYIALAVAYKNDDGEETTYWFNAGHAVTASGYNPEPRETVFDTNVLSDKPDDAELTVVYTTYADATYAYNGTVLPDARTGGKSYGAKTNSWYLTEISDDEATTLTAERIGSSYKWTLAALVTPAPPPEDLTLETVHSGTVTGGFFFESQDVYGAKPDGADRTVTFDLPEYDSIEWARLYTLVYSGHMTDDRAGRVITTFDGGDGVVELGNELLNIPAPRNGQVYWVNDNVNRVTSDYQIWYDVTGEITGTEVTAHVLSEEVDDNWDGRIRYIALAVAYKNDDGEETTYWFNAGHAVTAPGYNPEPRETVFDTNVLSDKPDDAELTVVYTTYADATYAYNGTVLPDARTGGKSYGAKTNSWYITDISDEKPTTLTAERIGSSYKWTLAALVTPAPPTEDLPLDTVKSGTVKGGFFFESQDVYGAKPAGADRTVTFELPEYDSIEWARLYTLVYAGHMTDERAGRVITTFDGGSGITELGNESLNIPAPRNGQVYWVNDHVNRVTSDYQIWYDVTDKITGTELTAHVLSQEVDANWDGRIRYIALAVAYKNDDGEETTYWFNAGHAVTAPKYNPEPREAIFDTSVLAGKPDNAELTVVYTTYADATYIYNGTVLPDAGTGGKSYGAKTNSWHINDIYNSKPTALTAERIGSSYKWTLAALVTDDSTIIGGSAEARTRDVLLVPVSVKQISEAEAFGFTLLYNPEYVNVTEVVSASPDLDLTYKIEHQLGRVIASASANDTFSAGNTPVPIALLNLTLSDNIGKSSLTFLETNFSTEYSIGFVPRSFAFIVNGELTNILRGDLNRNNCVDIGDVAKVAWIAIGLVDQDPMAKFVEDGKPVNHGDAAKIAYYYVGKIPVL